MNSSKSQEYGGNSAYTVFRAALVKDVLCKGLWIMKDDSMAAILDCQKQSNCREKKTLGVKQILEEIVSKLTKLCIETS